MSLFGRESNQLSTEVADSLSEYSKALSMKKKKKKTAVIDIDAIEKRSMEFGKNVLPKTNTGRWKEVDDFFPCAIGSETILADLVLAESYFSQAAAEIVEPCQSVKVSLKRDAVELESGDRVVEVIESGIRVDELLGMKMRL